MTEVAEDSGKASTLSDLTLEVRRSGSADQEVFLQHGLSLGRNPSNTLCIDHPDVERIHAQVLRQSDGSMLLECAGPTTQITLPDGKKVHELTLKPGTTFKIGPATIRCLKRQTKPSVVVTDNPWQVRCPCCHEVIAELGHDSHKCPSCKAEVFYYSEKKSKSDADVPGFEGWLPKHIGPYQVRAFVAQGGMGIVLRGLHKDNDMPAAVKLLKGDPDHDPVWKSRFEAEITTLTSLKHPNVVRLQSKGRDDKLLWLAMDWIDGVPLTNWIEKVRGEKSFIPLDQIRSAMTQIVSGLQYLHGRQIIHRDLKPSNILVSQDDLVKMVDFGIARTSSGNTSMATRLTQTGMVAGTESYMAPEQAEGRDVTPASDVYSLGVIWYELLTGRRPMGSFVSPESLRKDTPGAWSRGISQSLSMEPRMRPSLDEISRILSGAAAVPPPIPTSATVMQPIAPAPLMPMGSTGYVPAAPAGPTTATGYAPPPPPSQYGPPPVNRPAGSGFGAIVGKILHTLAHGAAAAAAGIGSFLKKHPPKEGLKKLGPVAATVRKNPKIWVVGGGVIAIVIVILLIRGLSDNSTPANNTPADNPNPAAAGANPAAAAAAAAAAQGGQNPAVNPGQQGAPAQPSPAQVLQAELGAYQAGCQAMQQQVMYAQFLPITDPRVSVTPEGSGTYLVKGMCQGYYQGRGFGALPYQVTVHQQPDGSFTYDQPQY
jgi:serine/threonine protein kinase/Zn finger protein HypA/HybF involved in hydrogenase expression